MEKENLRLLALVIVSFVADSAKYIAVACYAALFIEKEFSWAAFIAACICTILSLTATFVLNKLASAGI